MQGGLNEAWSGILPLAEGILEPLMNLKFSRPPAEKIDAHVPLGKTSLKEILCCEYERKMSNDYVVRFEKCLFQNVA